MSESPIPSTSQQAPVQCRVYSDHSCVYLQSDLGKLLLQSAVPSSITATNSDRRTVPLTIEKLKNCDVEVYNKGQKYTGKLVNLSEKNTVGIILDDGSYFTGSYDNLKLSSNPEHTTVKWESGVPVEVNYQTRAVTWTNVIEVRATPGKQCTITDTALIKSNLLTPFKGEVTLVKRDHNGRESSRSRSESNNECFLVQQSCEIPLSSDDSGVGTNVEVHKNLGYMELPSLLRLELDFSNFDYSQIYYVQLRRKGSYEGNAEIQLESVSPWYIQPAEYNLEYGSYNTTYSLPAHRKGELIRLPVTKSPEVSYAVELEASKSATRSDTYIHNLKFRVTVSDVVPDRKKVIVFGINIGDKVDTVDPKPSGPQKPGWIYWRVASNLKQEIHNFKIIVYTDNNYLSF